MEHSINLKRLVEEHCIEVGQRLFFTFGQTTYNVVVNENSELESEQDSNICAKTLHGIMIKIIRNCDPNSLPRAKGLSWRISLKK